MVAKTAWVGGQINPNSVAFVAAFGSEINSLATGSSVLSSLTFDNTVALDQFMDISLVCPITTSSVVAGAGVAFYLWLLQANGTTYGDGRMTAGTQVAGTTYTPFLNPLGGYPCSVGTGNVTSLGGSVFNITIPPRRFGLVVQNQTGLSFPASGCTCSISTYSQNTNA